MIRPSDGISSISLLEVCMNRCKQLVSLTLALVLAVCSCTACEIAKPVPDLETVLRYSEEEMQTLATTVDEQTLRKNWGDPQTAGNLRLWPVPLAGGTEFVVAFVEDGKLILLYTSVILFVTVVREGYCLFGWNEYSTNRGDLAIMPKQDAFGNEITYEVGDLFVFQFDGMIMESYPAQMGAPYSAMWMDHLSEEEIEALAAEIVFP